MVKNGFIPSFFNIQIEMDSFDRKIIKTLMDQKPQTFHHILTAVDFTYNTLQQHFDQL
jgi:DNA-binding Lrp family transcriptional regulator